MAFFEQRISDRFSYGAQGGPVFSTAVRQAQGGARFANQNWEFPLHRWSLAKSVETNEDFEEIRAFFYNVAGMFDGFRFKDASDYQATQDNSALEFITGSTWQLQRIYEIGSRTFVRNITKPVASPAAVVYRTRSAVVSVATASIATTTGIATISGHVSGDTYTWVGEFDVPVCFASDAMKAEVVSSHSDQYLIGWPSVEIEEIRL